MCMLEDTVRELRGEEVAPEVGRRSSQKISASI